MKFGFAIPTLTAFPRSTEKSPEDVAERFRRSYEICALAEELGYDFGTVGQHRFSPWTVDTPCPPVVLAALAARTSRLRLCTNILLLGTHHPIEIAEQTAMVDEISGGRLILGVGLGYRDYEYAGVGLDYKTRVARLEEGVAILRQAWSDVPVSFNGRHFDIREVNVSPKPIQQGGPPVWVGALARPAVARAARIGDGWIASGTLSLGALKPLVDVYFEAADQAGRQGHVVLMRKIGIGPSRQHVREHWLPGIIEANREYVRVGVPLEDKEFEAKLKSGKPLDLEDIPRDQFIMGTPEECVDEIRRYQRETGCEHIIADFGRGAHGMQYDQIREAMELFGKEVIPAFGNG